MEKKKKKGSFQKIRKLSNTTDDELKDLEVNWEKLSLAKDNLSTKNNECIEFKHIHQLNKNP